MLRRFGPFDLFSLDDSNPSALEAALPCLSQKTRESNSKGWRVIGKYFENITIVARWAFSKRRQIAQELPRTASGVLYKNRHLIIKQYEGNVASSGQSMSSRGFEGTNYRMVVASDKNREIKCRYGEYLNLSGLPLTFRTDYPKVSQCDICRNRHPYAVCAICGMWFCRECRVTCDTCGNVMCAICAKQNGPTMSAHEWYYHRKLGQPVFPEGAVK